MSDKTGIEWTDATWNPTKGCDKVSPGCDHCYALTLAKRLKGMGSAAYQQDGDPKTSGPGFFAHSWAPSLDQPLRWTTPRRIFVNSMSDLFHANITDSYIAMVFAVMARARQHTFQVLTKRHARMRSLLSSPLFRRQMYDSLVALDYTWIDANPLTWPLPNVWLGVSTEDQHWASLRIPALLNTPAAVRFISAEPLLGPIDLVRFLPHEFMAPEQASLDWVIVGGESGPGARPMQHEWATLIRDQCHASSVQFLFKQWGNHDQDGNRVGKHAAGRILDGRTWDEYPVAR